MDFIKKNIDNFKEIEIQNSLIEAFQLEKSATIIKRDNINAITGVTYPKGYYVIRIFDEVIALPKDIFEKLFKFSEKTSKKVKK